MTTRRQVLTKEEIAARLRDLPSPSELTSDISDLHWRYRAAASVLSFLDLERLHPMDGEEGEEGQGARLLLPDTAVVFDKDGTARWMLQSDVRRKTLRRLGTRERLRRALTANPERSKDPLQEMLTAYISGDAPPVEEQSLEQVASTLQVVEWLGDILLSLPDPNVLRNRIDRENILKPLRYLVGDHFRGRQKELQRLRDYVEVLPPGSPLTSLGRQLRRVASLQEKPPLLICGPGGVGKSTLLARFVLEHADVKQSLRFPFAYLDFDLPGLLAEEPGTLLIEAARQIAIQYPVLQVESEFLRSSWQTKLSQESERSGTDAASVPYGIAQTNVSLWRSFVPEFATLVEHAKLDNQPFLLILDTFEEVQYRSRDFVSELWDFLDTLQGSLPILRTVLAGRAQVSEFKTDDVILSDLDPEAALGLLEAQGMPLDVARTVAKLVQRNPLCLRLAVELVRREGIAEIREMDRKGEFKEPMDVQMVQGLLYRRILDHIHTPEVRKIAHPGLVLRRITPELIVEVLAGPCGVTMDNEDQARSLFRELAREASLVTEQPDGSLRHRSDVRRVMIALLRQDRPDQVRQIEDLAVAYYEQQQEAGDEQSRVVARTEEIYHRLARGDDPREVAERWTDEAGEDLRSAIDEVPLRAQAFLAARLEIERGEEVWAEANLEDWELYTERRVSNLLRLNRESEALDALHVRTERTVNSPLIALEAQALERLGRIQEARAVVQRGIEAAGTSPSTALLRLETRLAQLQGDLLGAQSTAQRVTSAAPPGVAPSPSVTGLTCLVTIDSLFQRQAPGEGTPGYADALHSHLLVLLGGSLGNDPTAEFGRPSGRGPVYVHSNWPPGSGRRDVGLSRLGSWSAGSLVATGAPLAPQSARAAHVALIYSPPMGYTPSSGSESYLPAGSQPYYTAAARSIHDLFRDAQERLEKGDPETSGGLQVPGEKEPESVPPGWLQRMWRWLTNAVEIPSSGPTSDMDILALTEQEMATYICREDRRRDMRDFVREALLRLCFRDDIESIAVNAHGQGSVVAFDVLRALPPAAAQKVKWLATSGSPLRKYVRDFYWGTDAGALSGMRWLNFWDPNDPIADPLVPPITWNPGAPLLDSRQGFSDLLSSIDPLTGEHLRVAITDQQVNNVANGAGGPFPAHNYWDNRAEFVAPLSALLGLVAQGA